MKKLLFILAVTTMQIANAQNNNSARIQVFKSNPDAVKSVTKSDSMAGHDHNCIKWNLSLLGRGVFLFNWEFRITGGLTAEVGLGLTYRDFIFELFKSNALGNGTSSTTQPSWADDGSPSINFAGEGGLRYYLSGFDNFEGIYVQGTISYRAYGFPNSPQISESGTTTIPGYNFFDAQFKIGYQLEGSFSDFIYDSYIGIGYRSASETYFVTAQSNGAPIAQSVIPQSASVSYPQFLFGFKIGYAF